MREKLKGLSSVRKTLLAVVGSFCYAFGINMFITRIGLYSGGIMGLCQLLRSLLGRVVALPNGIDLAGVFYYIINIPIFFMAYKAIGKRFLVRTLICVTAVSVFTSLLQAPAQPIVNDRLVSCIIGGFISGFGIGFTLRMGSSSGGTDIIGLYCIKRDLPLSVGNLSLFLNVILYGVCMIVFDVETAIYSIIFAACSSLALDRTYSQSINAEATIITKDHGKEIADAINQRLVRGVTSWLGRGNYTDEETSILCVTLSKYELSALRHLVREIDPRAFVIVKEGVKIEGNFLKKLDG